MNIWSKVSERIIELMNEAEINTTDLGDKIDADPSVISKFVNAQRLPSATTLVKLADFFGCTTDYIIGLSDILDDRKFKQRPPFNEQLKFLLEYFKCTRYRLEKEAKFSEETVKRWYRGICEPKIESLITLAKYFKCTVDFILGREV